MKAVDAVVKDESLQTDNAISSISPLNLNILLRGRSQPSMALCFASQSRRCVCSQSFIDTQFDASFLCLTCAPADRAAAVWCM